MLESKMFNLQLDLNDYKCEVCGESEKKPPLTGVDIQYRIAKPIQACRDCGPIEYEVMQLCREVVTGCKAN